MLSLVTGDRESQGPWWHTGALAGAVLIPVLSVLVLTGASEFVLDDILNLRIAQLEGLSLGYLLRSTSGHFAPGHLLADWFVQELFGFEFVAAQLIQVAAFAASLVLFHRIVLLLTSRHTHAVVATFIWGVSVANVETIKWWAAGIDRIPANLATFAAIVGYLLYRRGGNRAWLWASVAAMVAGLMFYVKVTFVPGYLVLIRVLLLEPDRPIADTIADARREWRDWIPYVAAAIVVGAVYTAYYPAYGSDRSLDALATYVGTTLLRVVGPNLLGLYVPEGALTAAGWVTILVAQAALVGFVAWTLRRRAFAVRAWAFFTAAAIPNIAAVAFNRLDYHPPDVIAYTNAFNQELYWLFFLAAAVAVAGPVAGASAGAGAGAGGTGSTNTRFARWVAPVGGVLLVLYTASSWIFGWHVTRPEVWVGSRAKIYFSEMEQSLRVVEANDRALIDGIANREILIPLATPYNNLSEVVPLLDKDVSFEVDSGGLYELQPDGGLREVRFARVVGGPAPELLAEGVLGVAEAEVDVDGSEVCVRAGETPATVGLDLPQPLEGAAHLRMAYRARSPSQMALIPDPVPVAQAPLFQYPAQRVIPIRDTEAHMRVYSLETETVDALFLSVLPGSEVCFSDLQVGLLVG